ncbi:exonuclease domain-containing protein [Paracoccus spongiarum]|uniref:DNA-directed DNA polymerase n=1 Tax=Paracoccus spongiarum TaxID=3064387 RepID=A0ABT9JBN8_9RHOB|nr:exonuclease domain-containing protein [Paracoccus sp. 2205BS29-5]MDP5307222.1 exonuclease domain-containing protein [Paracoccus sp. 2205BS29-5]
MLTGLPLRLRILMIFAALLAGLLGLAGLALVLLARGSASAGLPVAADPLVQAAAVLGFGAVAAVTLVWFLFDRHMARPIEALAGGLRTGRAPDRDAARYLADLGPASRAAAEARARSAEALAEAVRDHAADLAREKATMESILADIGAGALVTDAQGRVVFYNASAARLLPGLALDRPLSRHIAPGALEAAAARLQAGVEATDLVCLGGEGQRLTGRMRRLDAGTLLILRDRALERPAPRDALESLRRHAATLVPMLDALDGPIPPALARAIRDEGQGLAAALRRLSEIMSGDAISGRAALAELAAGLPGAADLPALSVLAEAGPMNAVLRHLHDRLAGSGAVALLRLGPVEPDEVHLRLEWAGPPVPMDLLEGWLAEAPDSGQPGQSATEILAAHGTGIWPEAGDGPARLVMPLRRAAGPADAAGLTFDFALASRGAASSRLADLTCVVFDTETTGLSVSQDRIVQIAGLRIARGRLTGERFETLVDPGRPIPPAATAIHHITDAMVAGAPDMTAALHAFRHFAEDAVLIAHNAPFDMGLLRAAAAETGAHFDNRVLDTVLLSAMVWGQSAVHTLDALSARLGIEIAPEDRHTAMGDAIATAEAFLRLIPALEAKGITRFEEAVAEARRHRRLIADANEPPHPALAAGAGDHNSISGA